ncbi:hypothetical protein HU200_025757 [Digitaria exilis]|uniref:Pentatricopeptide repeat-containing protein n=1 Tax=Digitaria exilis TaxID=1010633 RepID=A0A835BZG9_9POAL|nr:hypothetical protein HU200_025757 [Digitaria exilis]
MHASCGDLGVASALFESGARGDAVAWSAMISGCARRGDIAAARELFDESPVKDLVSWNVMITAYAKRGEMAMARELFDRVPERDVVSWNAMISGYVRCGSHRHAVELFEQMQCMGEKPDTVTVLSLLSACADSPWGMVDKGHKYFNLMQQRYRIEPNIKHYGCMVDMLSRAGLLKEAFGFIDTMKVDPNSVIWRTLLGACRIHGEIELAEHANRELLRARSDASGIIASIKYYASVCRMRRVRENEKVG